MREEQNVGKEPISKNPFIDVIQNHLSIYTQQSQRIVLINSVNLETALEVGRNDDLDDFYKLQNQLWTYEWFGKPPSAVIEDSYINDSIKEGVSFLPNNPHYKLSIITGSEWITVTSWINEWAARKKLPFTPYPFLPVQIINPESIHLDSANDNLSPIINRLAYDYIRGIQPSIKMSRAQIEDMNTYYKLLMNFRKIQNLPFRISDIG